MWENQFYKPSLFCQVRLDWNHPILNVLFIMKFIPHEMVWRCIPPSGRSSPLCFDTWRSGTLPSSLGTGSGCDPLVFAWDQEIRFNPEQDVMWNGTAPSCLLHISWFSEVLKSICFGVESKHCWASGQIHIRRSWFMAAPMIPHGNRWVGPKKQDGMARANQIDLL